MVVDIHGEEEGGTEYMKNIQFYEIKINTFCKLLFQKFDDNSLDEMRKIIKEDGEKKLYVGVEKQIINKIKKHYDEQKRHNIYFGIQKNDLSVISAKLELPLSLISTILIDEKVIMYGNRSDLDLLIPEVKQHG